MKILISFSVLLLTSNCNFRPYKGGEDHRKHKFEFLDASVMQNGDSLLRFKCKLQNCDILDTFILHKN